MINQTWRDKDRNIIKQALDNGDGTWTIKVPGEPDVIEPIPQELVDADTRRASRQARANRLEAAIASLAGPMKQTKTVAALRREVATLRTIIRDLVDDDA